MSSFVGCDHDLQGTLQMFVLLHSAPFTSWLNLSLDCLSAIGVHHWLNATNQAIHLKGGTGTLYLAAQASQGNNSNNRLRRRKAVQLTT